MARRKGRGRKGRMGGKGAIKTQMMNAMGARMHKRGGKKR